MADLLTLEAAPALSAAETHERIVAAIAERRGSLVTLEAELAAAQAQLAAHQARAAQAEADRVALPERIASAKASLIITPASEHAQRRLAGLQRAHQDATTETERLATERQALEAEVARLRETQAEVAELLPALTDRERETWQAVGHEQWQQVHQPALSERSEAVAVARAALAVAEAELAAARTSAQEALAPWPAVRISPDYLALVPKAPKSPAVPVMRAYVDYLRTVLAHAPVPAFLPEERVNLAVLLSLNEFEMARVFEGQPAGRAIVERLVAGIDILSARLTSREP
jgi:hypothetical protein